MIIDKQFITKENEEEVLSVIESFLNRLIEKKMLISNELRRGYIELPILDREKAEIVKEMIKDFKAYKEPNPDYQKGFNILMEYWDSLPDEEKPEINRRLKQIGI
jgi:hypothetical protein